MGFIQTAKQLFYKEYYDFESPDIDLYNFHPQLPYCVAPMGIFFNNKKSYLRYLRFNIIKIIYMYVTSVVSRTEEKNRTYLSLSSMAVVKGNLKD
jgi:hypothetical protein